MQGLSGYFATVLCFIFNQDKQIAFTRWMEAIGSQRSAGLRKLHASHAKESEFDLKLRLGFFISRVRVHAGVAERKDDGKDKRYRFCRSIWPVQFPLDRASTSPCRLRKK